MSLTRATLKSDNTVYEQLGARPRPGRGQEDRRDDGHHAPTSTATPPRRSAASRSASRRSRWPTPTRRSPTAATATARRRSRKIEFPDGHVDKCRQLLARFRVKRIKAFSDGVTAKATQILEENVTGGHRHARADRLPGGRQDRHDRRVHRRLVRRLHAAPGDPGVGRLSERQDPDAARSFSGGPVAGGTFPAEIWGEYMKQAKGAYCGVFPKPKQPFVASPFFGNHSHSGGQGTGETTTDRGSGGLGNALDTPGRSSTGQGAAKQGSGGAAKRRRGQRQAHRWQRRAVRPRPLRVAAPAGRGTGRSRLAHARAAAVVSQPSRLVKLAGRCDGRTDAMRVGKCRQHHLAHRRTTREEGSCRWRPVS